MLNAEGAEIAEGDASMLNAEGAEAAEGDPPC